MSTQESERRTYLHLPLRGEPEEFEVENAGSDFATLQKRVGGYLEPVAIVGTSNVLFCDEDGRAKGRDVNPRASLLAGTQIGGDVVILGATDKDGLSDSFTVADYRALAEAKGLPTKG